MQLKNSLSSTDHWTVSLAWQVQLFKTKGIEPELGLIHRKSMWLLFSNPMKSLKIYAKFLLLGIINSDPTLRSTHTVSQGSQLVERLNVEPGSLVPRTVQSHSHGILLQQSRQPLVHSQVLIAFQVQQLLVKHGTQLQEVRLLNLMREKWKKLQGRGEKCGKTGAAEDMGTILMSSSLWMHNIVFFRSCKVAK